MKQASVKPGRQPKTGEQVKGDGRNPKSNIQAEGQMSRSGKQKQVQVLICTWQLQQYAKEIWKWTGISSE